MAGANDMLYRVAKMKIRFDSFEARCTVSVGVARFVFSHHVQDAQPAPFFTLELTKEIRERARAKA